jgi:Zn-dependent metalloprotease
VRLRPILAALLALSATVAPATAVAAESLPSGHFTWTGSAAVGFALPADVQIVSSWHDAMFNLDYTRYQQYAAPTGTYVDGSQLTVVSRAGQQLIVAGAYYPAAHSLRVPALPAAKAIDIAADARGGLNELPQASRGLALRRAQLRLDPISGRLFYLVTTAAPGDSRYQKIDAQTGELLENWSGVDQVSPGQGVGVKGDTKTLRTSPFGTVGDLTNNPGGTYKLQSPDGRFVTYDASGGRTITSSPVMTDGALGNDDKWNDSTQAAGVDAQYYAALTIQFYRQEFSWDWFVQCSGIYGNTLRSVVHYGTNYDNAYWEPEYHYMVYGDGGTVDRPLSAGQDVVSHELSHSVTQCRASLDYKKESGALNEAFSDIMATSAEWAMAEPTSSNCRLAAGQTGCPDWFIGEDLPKTASGAVIRNLADPEAEGQPSHYSDRTYANTPIANCGSASDYCDVHRNNGIPNHAFFLLANGGRNARCSGPTDPQADCDVMVPSATLDHAMHIFFAGFGMLPTDATMCDARNMTVAQAAVLYPNSVTDIAATILAWQAVGLGDQCKDSTDFTISLADPTMELAPGGSGQLSLTFSRGSEPDSVAFDVAITGPASVDVNPSVNPPDTGSQITVDADGDAADGAYPILVTATGSGDPHYVAATLVIDAAAPSAVVANVRFAPMTSVTTSGVIPLNVTWSASDAGSGVASAELDHSPNGSGWSAIYGPGVPASPTQYSATSGPHQFQVIATDAVGNDATSPALATVLSAYQETAPTYKGGWKTFNSATAWGKTRFSKNRGASATFAFNGTDVVWIAQRGPKRGVATVFIDGVMTHVDLYASTLSERRIVFVAANLAAGPHTIKIVVRHTSGRPRVDVDGFFVLS